MLFDFHRVSERTQHTMEHAKQALTRIPQQSTETCCQEGFPEIRSAYQKLAGFMFLGEIHSQRTR